MRAGRAVAAGAPGAARATDPDVRQDRRARARQRHGADRGARRTVRVRAAIQRTDGGAGRHDWSTRPLAGVRLTSANPVPGSVQSGEFFEGVFRIEQSRRGNGLVSLVLRDTTSRLLSCKAASPARAAALSKRILGLLRGTAKGHFRTVGRFSAATVLGTNWGVRDRCDGTLTVVRTGVVTVRDFVLHRTVTVRTGQTYLAKAP